MRSPVPMVLCLVSFAFVGLPPAFANEPSEVVRPFCELALTTGDERELLRSLTNSCIESAARTIDGPERATTLDTINRPEILALARDHFEEALVHLLTTYGGDPAMRASIQVVKPYADASIARYTAQIRREDWGACFELGWRRFDLSNAVDRHAAWAPTAAVELPF